MSLLDKANRLVNAQTELRNKFITSFQEKGVDASNYKLKQMPELITQITGGVANVVISDTEPENVPEGTIWILPVVEDSDSVAASTVAETMDN